MFSATQAANLEQASDADAPAATPAFSTLANGMPILNSYPTATAQIFLDFDGGAYHTSSNVLAPYDTDGNPSTFGASEQADIYECWHQIAIYYAMFNVNVTTVQPASGPVAADVISPDTSGGVTFVNTFPDGVAQSTNPSSDARSRESGVAHELGHNFGNEHISNYNNSGVKTAEYHSAFDSLHDPIMGIDYQGLIDKWMIWHSTLGPDRIEDDVATISGSIARQVGGDGFRPDDVPGTTTSASPLTIGQERTGIIERMNDVDMYSFTSIGARYDVAVGREFPSSVDVKVSILNSAGQVVASQDGDLRGDDTMINDSQLTLDLAAGKYYVKVESHGNYGDLGQYNLHVDQMSAGLSGQDIGLNRQPGWSGYDPTTGIYTVAGGGHDVSKTADGLQFLSQPLSGSGSITAEVLSSTNPSDYAKGGLMIRASQAAGAPEFSIFDTSGHGADETFRTATDGNSTDINNGLTTPFAPMWLRITRNGSMFTAYTSTNGVNFVQFQSPQLISMGSLGSTVYIGLMSSGVDEGRRSTNGYYQNVVTFSNVTITGNAPAALAANSYLAPATVTTNTVTYNSLNLSWTPGSPPGDINRDGTVNSNDFSTLAAHFGSTTGQTWATGDFNGDGIVNALDFNALATNFGKGPTGYSVEMSRDGVNFTQIGTTAAGVTTFSSTTLFDDQRYFYRVRALNGSTYSSPSTAVNAVTRAGPVESLNLMTFGTDLILDWDDPSGESGFTVQRSNDGSTGWLTVGSVATNVPMFVNSGLTAGKTYYYRVETLDGSGLSVISSVISGTVPSSASIPDDTPSAGPTPAVAATLAASPIPSLWQNSNVAEADPSQDLLGTLGINRTGSDLVSVV